MSSNIPHEYLNTRDLNMLERVLARAGYILGEGKVVPADEADAARFLVSLFKTGIDSERDLLSALVARREGRDIEGGSQAEFQRNAISRWKDEGGSGADGPRDEPGGTICS